MIAELLIMLGISGVNKGLNSLTPMSKSDKNGVFLDGNGDCRLKSTMQKVYYADNKYGERVIKSDKNGASLINVDLNESIANEQEAKINGHQFYLRSSGGGLGQNKLGNDDIRGIRYCKIGDNQTYYVKRRIQYKNTNANEKLIGDFYMDMSYQIISPCESLIDYDIKWFGNPRYDLYEKIKELCKEKSKDEELWKCCVRGEHSVIFLGDVSYSEFMKHHRKFTNQNRK